MEKFDQVFFADEMTVRRANNCLIRAGIMFAAVPYEPLNPAAGFKFSTSMQGAKTLEENGIIVNMRRET